jgi:hypothetical protein
MTAHRASDNTAIEAAADMRLANARAALIKEFIALLEKGRRCRLEAVYTAGIAWCDEYTADLERELGRPTGAFGRLSPAKDAFASVRYRTMGERGERPLNHINRVALAEMGKADGEELA